jgi:hypothetical protein
MFVFFLKKMIARASPLYLKKHHHKASQFPVLKEPGEGRLARRWEDVGARVCTAPNGSKKRNVCCSERLSKWLKNLFTRFGNSYFRC